MKTARDRKFGHRRLLAVAELVLGMAAASTVGACGGSDRFDFKPRREGISGPGT